MSITLWPEGPYVTDHFRVADFACHDPQRTPYPVEWIETRLKPLCQMLEIIREKACYGKPIIILSGFRTPEWNAHVGGAADSRHVHGDAADWYCPWLELSQGPRIYDAILQLHKDGELPMLGGVGRYGDRSHVDVRPHEKGVLATWSVG